MRLLLLGGTGEARALAARLHPDVDVVSSLAGRVPDPALPVGTVRIGGFGGAAGLRTWLRDNDIDVVVDATHPFAATITANAAQACRAEGVPHVVLARPAWPPGAAIVVDSDSDAARVVAERGWERVFLTTGRSGTRAFVDVDAWFLIRAVTAPDPGSLPRRHELVLSRGPLPRRRRAGTVAALAHRRAGHEEQRRRHDQGEARGGRRPRCDGGDGGPSPAARRRRGGLDGRRRGAVGQRASMSARLSRSRIAWQPRSSMTRIISSPRSVLLVKAQPRVVISGACSMPSR